MAEPEDRATTEWIETLDPVLLGRLGRPPTPVESFEWGRKSLENKPFLVAWRTRYAMSGLREHLLRYLRVRQGSGFVEGVTLPDWLVRRHLC